MRSTYILITHIYDGIVTMTVRRVLRYQKGNNNPYMEEEQTTQWPKEKGTKGQTTIYKTCT